MSTPWFFLSYSCADDKEKDCVAEFFDALLAEVRRKGGLRSLKPGEIGFRDGSDLDVGVEWEPTLAQNLQTTRILVCLYSPTYFESEYCGRELDIFLSRLRNYENEAEPLRGPRRILPVLWENPTTLPNPIPDVAARIQNRAKEFGEEYAKEGLFFLQKTGQTSEYKKFIDRFAEKIVFEARQGVLPPLPDVPSLTKASNAFKTLPSDPAGKQDEEKNETTKKAERRDAYIPKTKTGWPLWLQIVGAIATLTVVIVISLLVINSGNGNNDNHGNDNKGNVTSTPTVSSTPFVDLFQPVKEDSPAGNKWAVSNVWSFPPEWDRLGDHQLGNSLVVRGTMPGAVKDLKFADSITRFRVEFVKGNKVGWVLHAQVDANGACGGYCFLLERRVVKGQPFKFSAFVCETGEQLSLSVNEVAITQYGKEADFIQVETVIKNNEFQFYFILRNYQEEGETLDKSRGNLGQCYPVSVKGQRDVYPNGSAGLFAGDNDTEFKISSFAVYPLTDENLKINQCPRR
jgi:TIR domain